MTHSFFLKSILFMFALTILVLFLSLAGCKEKPPDNPEPPIITEVGKAKIWLTRGDKTKLLNPETDLPITASTSATWPRIVIDSTITYQTIDGYGAALTGSSAYLLNRKLTPVARQTLLQQLFDPQAGIGISYLRLTMGASDFSLSDFTYNDMPVGQTDFNLDHFSLSQDELDVIPVLQEITAISPNIKLMGSPWSPPAWMKTSNNLKGGRLKTDCYDVYARYFVKYIQEMQQKGIKISSVTPQNEPLYFTANYPCMEMQAAHQLSFIKNHLGPVFQSSGLDTKIIIYDHNWDVTDYAITILNDPEARNFIAGTGFHAYAGDVSAMGVVHNAHPDKELHFTEISGGSWATDFASNLMWNMRNIFIGSAINWSQSVMMWNLALNEYHGPQNNGCSNCRGVITVIQSTGSVTFNEEYYSIGHFSKFVRPGAKRIALTLPQSLSNFGAVAFLNTDGGKVLIAANYGSSLVTYTVKQADKYFSYTIPAQSVITITW